MLKKIFICFLFAVLLVSASFGSYISLNTTVTSKIDGNTLQVVVTAVNKGDESAYSVQAELNVAGEKILAKKVPELGIDETYKITKFIDLDLKDKGQYPLIVTMHYADANQYPFSALTAQTFPYQAEDLPSEAFGRMRSTTFWKEGKVTLTLKNMGAEDIETTTNLIVPRELTARAKQIKMNIAAKSERKVGIDLENFSALSGSTYQVFAVSEFVIDGVHHVAITPGTAKIIEQKAILGINYTYLMVLLVLLILLFIVFQIFKK